MKDKILFSWNCKSRFYYMITMFVVAFAVLLLACLIRLIGISSSLGTWKLIMTLVYSFLYVSMVGFFSVFLSLIPHKKTRIGVSIGISLVLILISAYVFVVCHIGFYTHSLYDFEKNPDMIWQFCNADPYVAIVGIVLLGFSIFTIIVLGINAKKENASKKEEITEELKEEL
ncbi:MAG: hypothetical protein K6B64_05025 [Acholeplasmatales bacterium]|nr:hypothetical protein [Acholeplasmatales bacterium]